MKKKSLPVAQTTRLGPISSSLPSSCFQLRPQRRLRRLGTFSHRVRRGRHGDRLSFVVVVRPKR
jgi:hypothetical protein